MKKGMLIIVLALTLVLAACGKKNDGETTSVESIETEAENTTDADTDAGTQPDNNDSQSPDYEEIYKDVLDKMYQIVSHTDTAVNDEDDVLAVQEAANYKENPLKDIGYAFVDLSQDGFCELVIGSVDKNDYAGNVILAAYTYNYGQTVYSFGGPSRNPHYLTNDGKILFYTYYGYNSYGFGLSSVNSKGTELKCEDLIYVGIGPDGETMSVFENKDGFWDEDSAYLSDMTMDEFDSIWEKYVADTKFIELTPFEQYTK